MAFTKGEKVKRVKGEAAKRGNETFLPLPFRHLTLSLFALI